MNFTLYIFARHWTEATPIESDANKLKYFMSSNHGAGVHWSSILVPGLDYLSGSLASTWEAQGY